MGAVCRVTRRGLVVALLAGSALGALQGTAQADDASLVAIEATPAQTVAARKHFFGSENVAADGRVRPDRVIVSWFSVASLAMAIDGHVVLLDSYIHKGEERANYVPTTTPELVALNPEAIFIGHGHFDHAKTAGQIAANTGAVVVGTPEHCDQAAGEAAAVPGGRPLRCMPAVDRGSAPGAQVRELRPLGSRVAITALKHLHSALEPPDGEGHETSLMTAPLPDASQVLLHPPGPSVVPGANPSGDEGSSLLYQFRVGDFALTWHDSSGPLRSQAPQILDVLRRLPATDVQLGATLGFNDPANGMRDPVDYFTALRPRYFYPIHHDFVAEYGASKNLEGVFRREAAKRGPPPGEVRWLYDPFDYLRPGLTTFDLSGRALARSGCLARRSPIGPRSIGRVHVGTTRRELLRRVAPRPARQTRLGLAWCVKGSSGRVRAVFGSRRGGARARLVATTAAAHGNRGLRPATRSSRLRAAYPRARRIAPGLYRAGPRSTRLIAVRRNRVRMLAVADRALLRNRRALLRMLRLAGYRTP